MATRNVITHNGLAIKGGCITRRKHRAVPGTFAAKLSRCKPAWQRQSDREEMARVFAVRVQILLSITSIVVQVL
jgi:hypothetical protein